MSENGFLTDYERKYLENPEQFEEEHGNNAVRSVKMRIRKKRAAALRDLDFLDDRPELWEKQTPVGGQDLPPLEEELGTFDLHKPIPDGERTTIQVHERTRDELAAAKENINEALDETDYPSVTYDDIVRISLASMVQTYGAILDAFEDHPEFLEAMTEGQVGVMWILVENVSEEKLRQR